MLFLLGIVDATKKYPKIMICGGPDDVEHRNNVPNNTVHIYNHKIFRNYPARLVTCSLAGFFTLPDAAL
jgi:hypothetical protein